MVMPSGSLLPERDARMRATASAGDRRVDVSGRSSLRYISTASRSTSRRWRCCSAAAAASRAASARGHDNVRSGLCLVGHGMPFSELRLSEVRNISGEKQHARRRARQAQCAHTHRRPANRFYGKRSCRDASRRRCAGPIVDPCAALGNQRLALGNFGFDLLPLRPECVVRG
jgi:hypothetical protein